MNREDFPMLNSNIIYFDNAATTFKPKKVIDEMVNYYENYSVNAHRSDYHLSTKVDEIYEGVRDKTRKFINAGNDSEIVFTSGATESINVITNGYLKYHLKKGDEILVTKSEHASLLLPLYHMVEEIGVVIKYIPLDDEYKLTVDNVKKSITSKTKVIAIAHVSNVIGDIRPIRQICEIASGYKIITLIDGTQAVPHMKINVRDLDVSFYVFSAHKMYGPTGVGVLYGKFEILDNLIPCKLGGGMNATFYSDGVIEYKDLPERLEAGTQNIAGIIGLGAAIDYISDIGLNKIEKYEKELADYAVEKLKGLNNITIYNDNPDSSIITFNMEDIFSQDLAIYLDKYNICVRAGSHCAKILKDDIGIKNTCRISLSFYNSKEEIDSLIKALSNKNILKELV